MKIIKMKDYSDDDSTQTLETVNVVTEQNCIVEERLYSYLEEDTLEVKHGLEITLEVPKLDLDDLVYRTLEDLREDAEGVEDDVPTLAEFALEFGGES